MQKRIVKIDSFDSPPPRLKKRSAETKDEEQTIFLGYFTWKNDRIITSQKKLGCSKEKSYFLSPFMCKKSHNSDSLLKKIKRFIKLLMCKTCDNFGKSPLRAKKLGVSVGLFTQKQIVC